MSIDAAIDGDYQLAAGKLGYQHYTITVPYHDDGNYHGLCLSNMDW